MARPDSVTDCKTASEFCRAAARQGGEVRGGGRHDKIYLDGRGPVPIPRHSGDIPTGTRRSIVRALLTLGFMLLAVVCLASSLTLYLM